MKRLRISELVPGMVTAEDVFNYNGQMVLPCGMTLTDRAITRLEFYSILSVKIEDALTESGVSYESTTLSQRIQESAEFKAFTKDYDDGLRSFKDSINRLVTENEPLPVDEMLDNALHILKQASTKYNTLDMLHNMRQYDDLTFAHSMNVALICNVFSKWLKWSPEDQRLLTMCGLLHDIGKVKIPDAIIKKPDRLTEEEYKLVKTHAVEGYHILKAQNLDTHVVNSALMHHEKCDGSGYPLGLAAERIDRFAKAVAVVDVYDAMTSARIYRGALCPFRVIELFESEGLQKYDAEFILTFLENIVNTYLHNEVRLSNGMTGHIVFSNKMNLSKPIVQCGDTMVDLSQEHDLHIDELL